MDIAHSFGDMSVFYPCEEGEEGARAMQSADVPRGKAGRREWSLEDLHRVIGCVESSPTMTSVELPLVVELPCVHKSNEGTV